MRSPWLARAPFAHACTLARSRWAPLLLGLALCLPAVGSLRVLDDHVLELAATGSGELIPRAPGLDLFEFTSGEPAQNLDWMGRGVVLPWWSDPALKIGFFRPLSSLTHRLDFALWRAGSELMYLHSLLWLGVLLALVARLYARVEAARPRLAWLASLGYAASDAHGAVVAWLSNRNALLAASGAVACVLAQQCARREQHRWSRWLGPLCLGLGLFAGELALGAWAFLLADAIALDPRPLRRRLAALFPHLLVTSGWAAAYVASGAGTRGSGLYLHPLQDPVAFLHALPERAVLLLGAAFGPLPAELGVFGSRALLPLALGVGLALLAATFLLQRPRATGSDPELRFWWIAAALAVLPVAASFPSDRLLLLVNVAALPVVCRVLLAAWGAGGTRGQAVLAALLFATHVLLAPLLGLWRAQHLQQLGTRMQRAFAVLQSVPQLEERTVIVLGAPVDFFVSYVQVERAARGLPRPERLYWFANPEAALEVRSRGERGLSLTRAGGFFVTSAESLYRRTPLAAGSRISLPELSAELLQANAAGVVERVQIELEQPLTSQRYVFLAWHGSEYRRVSPQALARLHIPPASLLQLLAPGA